MSKSLFAALTVLLILSVLISQSPQPAASTIVKQTTWELSEMLTSGKFWCSHYYDYGLQSFFGSGVHLVLEKSTDVPYAAYYKRYVVGYKPPWWDEYGAHYYPIYGSELVYLRADGEEEVVYAGNYFSSDFSLAVDSNGNPGISYYDPPSGALWLATKNAGTNVWSLSTVTTNCGEYSSLAYDSDGNPHLSYCDNHWNLAYATISRGYWTPEVVDPASDCKYTSLALDTNGNPHIAYYDHIATIPLQVGHLKYAVKNGDVWSIESVDAPEWEDVGKYLSLALDSDGNPHISYYDETNHALKYAVKNHGAWRIETLEDIGYVTEGTGGMSMSTALDSKGYPHISYYNELDGKLKYASKDESGWSIETVDYIKDPTVNMGRYSSLALDSTDHAHIIHSAHSNSEGHTDAPDVVLIAEKVTITTTTDVLCDTSFRPNPNGYQFRNFGGPVLSWDFFRNTFGADQVEINGVPTPRAQTFYDHYFKYAADGGDCFGMASSSMILYQHSYSAWNLGGDRSAQLPSIGEQFIDTNGNGLYDLGEPFVDANANGKWDSLFPSFLQATQDLIEYYQALQFSAPVQQNIFSASPRDVYDKLKQRMSGFNWTDSPMVLCMYFKDGGGHAVVPYMIKETTVADSRNPSEIQVESATLIYDNNFPNSERVVHFDFQTASGSTSDDDYKAYGGLASLDLRNLTDIEAKPEIPDFESVSSGAHLLYTDSAGNHLGYVNGQSVSEIDGAHRVQPVGQDQSDFPETYFIGNLDLKREVIGLADGTATVSVMRPHSVATVDVQTTAGSDDEVVVSQDGLGVQLFSHGGTPSVSITIAPDRSNFARSIRVSGFGVEAGSSVAISLSADLNRVFFTNNGVAKSYNVHFEQTGTDPYSHDNQAPLVIEGNSAQDLQFMDNVPPNTILAIGKPKYVSTLTYVTPDAPFTLAAADAGSGVNSTAFRIASSNGYDSGWLDYAGPFKLASLRDGNYTIAFNSTDSVGNVENTNKMNVTLVGPDVNGDGKVDVKDIAIAGRAFGSYLGHPRWSPIADFNLDCRVDLRDIILAVRMFGKHYP